MGSLHDLHEDVLVYVFDLLDVPQILVLRQTCRRMQKISELRIVWTNACNHQILRLHYPFPDVALEDLSIPELERNTRYSYRLALEWLSENPLRCHVSSEFDATNGTPVSDLRFVHGHGGTWLLAVSKGIWSVLALWELGDRPRKRFEWSRRDCLLQSFVLNGDPQSAATLAVSLMQEGHPHVEIISLGRDTGFRSISTIDSGLDPVYFHGDILVLCDPIDVSVIVNWKTGASAVLRRSQDASQSAVSINDRCIQVIFAPSCLLVVRARSLTLFSNPPLTPGPPAIHAPIAVHSFGWVDGVAVTTIINPSTSMDSPPNPPLSILLRPEPDDPWAADDDHALDLYVLHPEPTFPLLSPHPYVFPPTHTARVPSTRGSLQCSDLRLGPHGTAVWIAPQDRSAAGLLHDADVRVPVARQHERLVCAAFPGPLFPGRVPSAGDHDAVVPVTVPGRTLCGNALNNWKALDYDEARGLVALGSTGGKITVLFLAAPF